MSRIYSRVPDMDRTNTRFSDTPPLETVEGLQEILELHVKWLDTLPTSPDPFFASDQSNPQTLPR